MGMTNRVSALCSVAILVASACVGVARGEVIIHGHQMDVAR